MALSPDSLNKYDHERFCETPLLRTIHKCAMKDRNEIGMMPIVPIDGCSYDTPILKQMGANPIFRKHGQGACSSKSEYDKVNNKTFGFDTMVRAKVRDMECESQTLRALLGTSLFRHEIQNQTENIFERVIDQLYHGKKADANGFGGLPEATCWKIDALQKEWNDCDDFAAEVAGKEECLYSIYLVRVAEQATREAPGLKWIGQNNGFIKTGEARTENMEDPDSKGCYFEVVTQHLYGGIGMAYTCATDVIEIANVPTFAIDGFYLENVISNAAVMYNNSNKFNRILVHKLVHNRMWKQIQNTNMKDRNCCIVTAKGDGGFGRKQINFFDGVDETPFVFSDCMPSTGYQEGLHLDVKEGFKRMHDINYCPEPSVPSGPLRSAEQSAPAAPKKSAPKKSSGQSK